MSRWPSTKASKVYRALLKNGWNPKPRKKGSSHVQLVHPQRGEHTWAFHKAEEIGPNMARIAKHTGLTRDDL